MSIGWLPTLTAVCSRNDGEIRLTVSLLRLVTREQAPVRRVARDLRRLGDVLERHGLGARCSLLVSIRNSTGSWSETTTTVRAVAGDGDAGERMRRLDLAEQLALGRSITETCAVFLVLGVDALAVGRDDQAVRVGRAGVDRLDHLVRLAVDHRDHRAVLAGDVDQPVGAELERMRRDIGAQVDVADMRPLARGRRCRARGRDWDCGRGCRRRRSAHRRGRFRARPAAHARCAGSRRCTFWVAKVAGSRNRTFAPILSTAIIPWLGGAHRCGSFWVDALFH